VAKQSSSQNALTHYARLWGYFKHNWLVFAVAMGCASMVGLLDAMMPLSIKLYLDMVLFHKNLIGMLSELPSWTQPLVTTIKPLLTADVDLMNKPFLIPLGIIGFTLLQGVFNYGATYLNMLMNVDLVSRLKRHLYETLLNYEPAFFDKANTGEVLVRFSGDADMATAGVTDMLKASIIRWFTVVGLSLTLLSISWKLAVVALLVLSSIIIPLTLSRKYLKRVSHDTVEKAGILSSFYTEALQGNRVIRVFDMPSLLLGQFDKTLELIRKISLRFSSIQGVITPVMHSIAGVGIGLVLFFGTGLIQSGELSPGGFASFIASLILLYTPLKSLGNMSTQLNLSYMALQRVYELIDRPSPIVFAPESSISLTEEQPNPQESLDLKTGITVSQVGFQYSPDLPFVLQQVNLTIAKGETVALVGHSGSGKTTLAHLLLRLYDPTEGHILYDGKPIKTLSKAALTQLTSAVFQDNFLFVGTVRENIMLANPSASEGALLKAIEAAHLAGFIDSLPQGLNTQVGERGVMLSGGQRQRLAIARAFLKNAPILVLDEATSALDNQSEAIVQEAIDDLMKNRTVIVIAHRLSTIMNANRIVVMQEGQIVEQGTHQGLLAQAGVYALLYNAQFKTDLNNKAEARLTTTL
jgi:ATP-binding cassette, subfamily B, bacterial MsbA